MFDLENTITDKEKKFLDLDSSFKLSSGTILTNSDVTELKDLLQVKKGYDMYINAMEEFENIEICSNSELDSLYCMDLPLSFYKDIADKYDKIMSEDSGKASSECENEAVLYAIESLKRLICDEYGESAQIDHVSQDQATRLIINHIDDIPVFHHRTR